MTVAFPAPAEDEQERVRRWAEAAARAGAPLASFFLTHAEARVVELALEARNDANADSERASPFLYAMQ